MDNQLYHNWPSFTHEEIRATQHILLSNKVNYWTGQEGRLFEQEFATWCGTKYAIAVSNGTVALDASLYALGISSGDEVIVTPRTFIASASSIVMAKAKPVFVDVDPNSQNITAKTIAQAITSKTRAILCVHLAGWPCDMQSIMQLAKKHKLYVIEDCAQAHGAKYRGRSVGSFGDISAWSFCQDKIITTGGEGGMITTNDKKLWEKVWSYKDHGKSWNAVYERTYTSNQFRWLHESFGTNARMLEIQAAIGRIQLGYLQSHWHNKRLEYAKKIWHTAKHIEGLRVPIIPNHIEHAAYKCYVFVETKQLKKGWGRDRILYHINKHGVPCYAGSCSEVYLEKAFDNTGLRPKRRLPITKKLGETSLMFLVHPTLTEQAIQRCCDVLEKVMSQAVRSSTLHY